MTAIAVPDLGTWNAQGPHFDNAEPEPYAPGRMLDCSIHDHIGSMRNFQVAHEFTTDANLAIGIRDEDYAHADGLSETRQASFFFNVRAKFDAQACTSAAQNGKDHTYETQHQKRPHGQDYRGKEGLDHGSGNVSLRRHQVV